jgi:hypothetical protein
MLGMRYILPVKTFRIAKTVAAYSNDTPCFSKLPMPFRTSHETQYCIYTIELRGSKRRSYFGAEPSIHFDDFFAKVKTAWKESSELAVSRLSRSRSGRARIRSGAFTDKPQTARSQC